MAVAYQNKSVAEQNSVDVSWKILMSDRYGDLRRAIYTNKGEFALFRSIIVNAVVATDIVNKELGDLRKARWSKAFSGEVKNEGVTTSLDRKTTIIIECIMQASDIAHTMQRKFFRRLIASKRLQIQLFAHRSLFFLLFSRLAHLSQMECSTVSRNVQSIQGRTRRDEPC